MFYKLTLTQLIIVILVKMYMSDGGLEKETGTEEFKVDQMKTYVKEDRPPDKPVSKKKDKRRPKRKACHIARNKKAPELPTEYFELLETEYIEPDETKETTKETLPVTQTSENLLKPISDSKPLDGDKVVPKGIDADDKKNDEGIKAYKVIATIIHVFLTITGVYLVFFGFRVFRLLMIILGFIVSYYMILFFLTEIGIYKFNDLGYQLGLFFSCIALGFGFAIACYMLERINFLIFGTALGSCVALFYAQFFVELSVKLDRLILFSIYLLSSGAFTLAAFVSIDKAIIWGTALIGSIIALINLGVILDDFQSFETRTKLSSDNVQDFIKYIIFVFILYPLGLSSQFYLRKRILRSYGAEDIEGISDPENEMQARYIS